MWKFYNNLIGTFNIRDNFLHYDHFFSRNFVEGIANTNFTLCRILMNIGRRFYKNHKYFRLHPWLSSGECFRIVDISIHYSDYNNLKDIKRSFLSSAYPRLRLRRLGRTVGGTRWESNRKRLARAGSHVSELMASQSRWWHPISTSRNEMRGFMESPSSV